MKRRYRCDTCHKPFKLSSSLRNHKKLHDKYGGFVCHLCGTDFIWQQSLVCHASFHVRAGDALNIQSFLDDNSSMLTILPSLEENTDQLLQIGSTFWKAISTCQKFPLTNAISGRTFILIV
ncbi:Protein odd-skipped-related 2-B [Trichinella pseudospiralis]|uniref:Protein odd-skipped-related 2-B n=1 Tax=Trichinella pseudospiralis TaxID=6337 RepID=A0A0V1JHN4_TRIPS|nr:Protein odd-skipped-related 2-B [Trichinella pseudospiralis]